MVYRTLTPQEFSDIASRILYEDNHILVFNKRPGEMAQGDRTGDEPLPETLKAFIAARDSKPGQVFMGVPHRLDRPVSGIVIFAKTSKALDRLGAMFRAGEVHKKYVAICCSRPSPEEGELRNLMVRDGRTNKSHITEKPGPDVKEARLRYRLVADTDRYHIVEVELLTGRHHQIRCQLSHIGCTIKGDLKYGAPRSNPDGGICLHSRSVSFIHPVKKERVDILAPFSVASSGPWPEE